MSDSTPKITKAEKSEKIKDPRKLELPSLLREQLWKANEVSAVTTSSTNISSEV